MTNNVKYLDSESLLIKAQFSNHPKLDTQKGTSIILTFFHQLIAHSQLLQTGP